MTEGAGGEKPVLDLSPLIQIFGSLGADCVEMLTMYVSSTAPLLQEVSRALAAGDLAAARQAANSAKGASNVTGAYRLGALCSRVDEALRQGDDTSARDHARDLPAAFEDVKAAVEREIAANEV